MLGVCVGVLGGALAVSWSLGRDPAPPLPLPTEPVVATPVPPTVVVVEPPARHREPRPVTPTAAPAPQVIGAAEPGRPASAPVVSAAPVTTNAEQGFSWVQSDPDLRWEAGSKELAYAEALLARQDVSREALESVANVYSNCLYEEPTNERCRQGLSRAQQALAPDLQKRFADPGQFRNRSGAGLPASRPTLQKDLNRR